MHSNVHNPHAMVGDDSLLEPKKRSKSSMSVPPAAKQYLKGFTDLADTAFKQFEGDLRIDVSDPLSDPAMQAIVQQVRTQYKFETSDELWKRITLRTGRSTNSDAKYKGSKVRKALNDRLTPPLAKLKLGKDDLDTTIAKLVLIALTDKINDLWDEKLDVVGDDLSSLIDTYGASPDQLLPAIERLYESKKQ